MGFNNRPKYIIYKDLTEQCEVPVLFPHCLTHHDVAKKLNGVPVSAGFFVLKSDGEYETFGRSESIGIDSRPEDSDILNCYLTG
jgi:hypothetical protein